MMMSARNKSSSFTGTQWQELDQQVLIYKYMVSGVPIPQDLISTVKRSLESSMSSRFFPHQPVGWGCFQMGFGRKADPEPGRCRRTDGKKWRCSKEAHPDSKYCERHMHRGRNRSRKPVELTASSSSTTTISYSSQHSISPLTTNPSSPLSSDHQSYPFLYPHSSSSRAPPASFPSPQNTTTHHLFLDSASYSHTDKDYSYVHGVRDEEEGRASFTPLTMSSKFQRLISTGNSREQQQEKHCFIMGTDFKSASAMPIKAEREEEKHKPFHHFFGEWQPKSREYSWLEVEENQSNHANFHPTELSISIPPSTQELFGSESTFHTDG